MKHLGKIIFATYTLAKITSTYFFGDKVVGHFQEKDYLKKAYDLIYTVANFEYVVDKCRHSSFLR